MIYVGLIGYRGLLGRALHNLITKNDSFFLSETIGKEYFLEKQTPLKNKVDVFIDCSDFTALEQNLLLAQKNKKPLIIATSAHQEKELERMKHAAKIIPIFFAPNLSINMAIFTKLVTLAAKLFHSKESVDIFDSHHKNKKDKPSGTALLLKEKIAPFFSNIHMHSIRTGDVSGEHLVSFSTHGEKIDLRHQSLNRDIYAQGALEAAQFITQKTKGFYTMEDLLDEKFSKN